MLVKKYFSNKYAIYFSNDKCIIIYNQCHFRPVVPGGAGGAMAPPDFGRSVNPISTKGDRLCPPCNSGTPGFSDLPTALHLNTKQLVRYRKKQRKKYLLWFHKVWLLILVKFSFSEKATKIHAIFLMVWTFTVNVQTMRKIVLIFVAFSEKLN